MHLQLSIGNTGYLLHRKIPEMLVVLHVCKGEKKSIFDSGGFQETRASVQSSRVS